MAALFRIVTCIAIFASLAAPAHAAGVAAETLISSAEALGEKIEATPATANPPMLSNGDASLVRTAYDADGVRALAELDHVSRACIAIGNSIVAYASYAGRSVPDGPNRGAAVDAKIGALQNEMTAGSIAANLCVQRGFRVVAGFVTTLTPEQRATVGGPLADMRNGAALTISSSVETTVSPHINAGNKAKLLDAVLEDLRFVASSFPAAERGSLRTKILAAVPELPAAQVKQVRAMAAILSDAACNDLCELSGAKP